MKIFEEKKKVLTFILYQFTLAIQETLAADVRSKYQTKKGIEDARLEKNFYFPLDNAMIYYLWQSERSMVVKNISLAKSVSSSEQ